jgi:hypothetical protein
MNSQVFDLLVNHLYDAAKLQKNEGHNATSDDTKELWSALMDKEKESM